MDPQELRKQQIQFSQRIEDGLSQFSQAFAEVMVEGSDDAALALEPKQVRKDRVQKEVQDALLTIKKRVENGITDLLRALIDLSMVTPEVLSEQVIQEIGNIQIISLGLDNEENAKAYFEKLSQGTSFQEIFKISDATLESLYQAAKYLYDHERFEEAANAFSVLCLFQGKQAHFWLALGHSEYICQRFDRALGAYAMVALMNPAEISCHISSCKCYEAIHQQENAINALDIALFVIGDDKSHDALRNQVIQYKEKLLQKTKK